MTGRLYSRTVYRVLDRCRLLTESRRDSRVTRWLLPLRCGESETRFRRPRLPKSPGHQYADPVRPQFRQHPSRPGEVSLTVCYPGRLRPHWVETVTVSVALLQRLIRAGYRKRSMDPILVRLVIPAVLPGRTGTHPEPIRHRGSGFSRHRGGGGVLPDCRVEVFRHGKVE